MNKNTPNTFLKVLNRADDEPILGLTACAGFELNKWRVEKLVEHLINWLPHFALIKEEIERLGTENPFLLLKEAATRIYQSPRHASRGEIGELLLHIIATTEYKAHSFVSRFYYKMRSNDQITGFDSALVTFDDKTEDIEVWLGESKFYKNRNDALSAAIKSVEGHLEQGILEETKLLIGPKIEKDTPGYDQLRWLFEYGNTLDEIIKRIVVPVLVAAESDAIKSYDGNENDYQELILEEYTIMSGKLTEKDISQKIKIVLIYIPLLSKEALEGAFDKRLGAIQ